jgi:hypothetical protein
MLLWDDEKPKRKPMSKTEWEVKKKMMGNKCVICGGTEKQSGGFIKAHIKAHSKGGGERVPMCRNCHNKYDAGKLTATQLRKIGLTPGTYKRIIPSRKKRGDWLGELP